MKAIALKILAGLVFLGTVAVSIPYAIEQAKAATQDADEYPDAPFRPVGKDFPRIIPVKAVQSAAEQNKVRQLLVTGAISKASPQEREVLQLNSQGKYVKARDLAEKILETQPESVPALLALAECELRGEAQLARALFHVRQARKLLEQLGMANPDDAINREWYLRALDLEYHILRDLDQAENQLRVVVLIEQIYEPLPWLKIWPLMKCKRLDEAETALKETEKTGNWRLHALNSRCALEEQRGHRLPTYQAGLAMTKEIPWSPCLWSNLGGAALNALLLDEAERAFLKSVSLGQPDFNGTAYRPLALLYIQQGRFPEALDALKKGRGQRAQRRPHTLQQDQSKFDRTIGLLLLAVGKIDSAERFTGRPLLNPDRTGGTTDDEIGVALSDGLVHWTVLSSKLEQLCENNAAKTGLGRFTPSGEQKALEFQIWTLRQKLLKILQDPVRLNSLRPYMPGQSEMEAWLLGGLVHILPSGVAEEALRQMRQAEDHAAAVPYFDSMEAEIALGQGRLEDAWQLASKALEKLPVKGEKLLRARTAVAAAEAARRLGRTSEAMAFFDQALRDFPQAFRLLQVAIPVKIEADASPQAQQAADAIRRSPRFREDQGGFVLSIRTVDGKLTIELLRLGQTRHVEVSVPVTDDADALVADALRRFLDRLMSPTLDLSEVDVNSLDGSLAPVRLQNDIDGILGIPAR